MPCEGASPKVSVPADLPAWDPDLGPGYAIAVATPLSARPGGVREFGMASEACGMAKSEMTQILRIGFETVAHASGNGWRESMYSISWSM